MLLSGGIDSATVGAFLKFNEGKKIYPIIVMYGQKHDKEILAARRVAQALKFEEPLELDLSDAFKPMKSELLDKDHDVHPDPHRDTVGSTYVPMRNTVLLSIAAGYAESIGASEIAYGAHKDDSSDYPDCTEEYYHAMQKLVKVATNGRVELRAPFIRWHKKDVVQMGAKLGVPYELTWSCYNGREKHCGNCPTCTARQYAFLEAGVIDPTEYER
jgi:7-cyano-7-deazaguanine synthase